MEDICLLMSCYRHVEEINFAHSLISLSPLKFLSLCLSLNIPKITSKSRSLIVIVHLNHKMCLWEKAVLTSTDLGTGLPGLEFELHSDQFTSFGKSPNHFGPEFLLSKMGMIIILSTL